jgi:steroid 5-alpha reductase family enzyme
MMMVMMVMMMTTTTVPIFSLISSSSSSSIFATAFPTVTSIEITHPNRTLRRMGQPTQLLFHKNNNNNSNNNNNNNSYSSCSNKWFHLQGDYTKKRVGQATTRWTSLSMSKMTSSSSPLPTLFSFFSGNNNPVWTGWGLFLLSDLIGLVVSLTTGSHVHLDLLGTGAFALVAATVTSSTSSLFSTPPWSSLAVGIWGTKLAAFLFGRALTLRHDARLSGQLSSPRGTMEFWAFTLMWQVIVSLPHLLGMLPSSSLPSSLSPINNNPNVSSTACLAIGGTLYVLGLVIETLADAQKWFFKRSHPPTEFCNVGLWKISQHPNFFGNLLLWVGILILNLPSLLLTPTITSNNNNNAFWSLGLKYWKLVMSLLSPWFSYTLFYGQASGRFLNSVELAKDKYGNHSNYEEYISKVPLIFPNVLKILK